MGNTNTFLEIIQHITKFIAGDTGKAAVVLIIVVCGIMWWLKKLSIPTVCGVVGGTALVFGASFYYNQFFSF